jgi:LppX_LprAFG lipoprotein
VREARSARSGPLRREEPRRGRLLVAALICALPVAACGGGKHASAAPPTRTIVANALKSTRALRSVHFVFKVEHGPAGGPGLTITFADGDIAVPDQLRARINGTFGRTPIQSEIVISGSRSFLKDPLTMQWRPFDAGVSPAVFVQGVPALLRRATGVTRTGSEAVGGKDSYRVAGQVRSGDVAPLFGAKPGARLVPFTVWVDEAHYYLRRIRLEGPVGDGEPADIVRTIELSAFDAPVTITLPTVPG